MPNTREKLIELLERGHMVAEGICSISNCDSCPARGLEDCYSMFEADHLIANGVTVQEWISVKDRLPDTAERVLVCKTWNGRVYKPEYGYYQDFPNQKGCWYVLTDFGYYPQREVTHWMHLPQPPKGE